MITEVIYDEKANRFELLKYTPVAVKEYGSEGCMPIDICDCAMAEDQNDSVSCISGSGGSICYGFYGHIGNNIIRCTAKKED